MAMGVEDKMSGEEGSSSIQDLKERKPYTITRPRERWTTEEHQRFLEALRLHGRAWRRIQEHIGTKTAVQIRSHAQKFFSKVVKESASGSDGSWKLINIPPPRPKRKPMHPYPRKSHIIHERTILEPLQTSSSPITMACGPDNQSPTSVLSDTFGMQVSSAHEQEEGDQDTPGLDAHKCPVELDVSPDHAATSKDCSSVETQTVSLRLFGRTLLVTDSHGTTSSSFGDKTKHRSANKDLQNQTSDPSQALDHGDRYDDGMKIEWSYCPASSPSMLYCLPHGNTKIPLPWFMHPLNFPFPFIHPQNIISCEQAGQEECSNSGSNTTSDSEMETHDKEETTLGIDATAIGFVPYKS
ncbi:putative transcription factor MYB-HB-like family [Dioscorea sansibarensis]